MVTTKAQRGFVKDEIDKLQIEFKEVLIDSQKNKKTKIKHQPGKTILQSFENKVNVLLNNNRSEIGRYLNKTISLKNNLNICVLSGSKGNFSNISQIAGNVGQQNVDGKRIGDGFLKRTLPHFVKDDLSPGARGFVASSFMDGLMPEEFFFHTMGGREGIIDTAVKTSTTGYMNRRLVKAMEDVMVQYDSTVRDSYGNVVQFLYGEDGIAGEYIEEQHIFTILKDSDEHIINTCCFYEIDETKHDLGFDEQIQRIYEDEKISTSVRDSLMENQSAHKTLQEELLAILSCRDELRTITSAQEEIDRKGGRYLPVNIDRLVTQAQFNISDKGKSDLNPIDVVADVKKLSEELAMVHGKDDFAKQLNDNALKFFRAF